MSRSASSEEFDWQQRALEELSYAVSHDLPAPVRALNGYLAALSEDYGPAESPELGRYVSRLERAAQRLDGLLGGLQQYTRVLRAELHPVVVDVSRLANEVIEEFRAGAEVTFTASVAPNIEVVADRLLLRTCIEHLASNALKFASSERTLHLEVFATSQEARETGFAMRDNGVGFDLGLAETSGDPFRLFKRFHPHSQFSGIGAGLACVQAALMKHRGRLWCESTPGTGTTFFVELPMSTGA